MKSSKKDIEKAITKAKKFEKAQEIAVQILHETKPALQQDKIWEDWERALLTALILHCALTKDKTAPLDRLDKLLSSADSKVITEALTSPLEEKALKLFEGSLELTPVTKVTDKVMNVRANRWAGTMSGLSNRINRLREPDPNNN